MQNFDGIQNRGVNQPQRKTRRWKWLILLLVLALGIWGATWVLSKTNQIFTNQGNIFTRVGNLLISPDKELIGESQGVVNILLMGIGGSGHDGPNLTDTMIVASLNIKSQEVVLTSIPRDFALQLPKVGFNKINAAYAYAYRDDPNEAGKVAIAAAEQVTGIAIPYYAVIDFKGFVMAVNDVGGVDVTVDQTFTDSAYPDYKEGYLSPISFTAGAEHMSGERALQFARSRHGNNNEGSDFARSERQKKILTAFKDKVFKLNLTNLATLNNLLNDFTDNFRTNLEPYQMKRLADLVKKTNSDNIYSFALEPQAGLICSELVAANTGERIRQAAEPFDSEMPEIIRMYVIIPCPGKNLDDIHEFVAQAPLLAKLKGEAANIEIQNSTGKTGLANQTFGELPNLGLSVKFTTFKGKVAYDQTILYDNSKGHKPKTLDYLKNNFSFMTSDVGFPSSAADFLIIMGKDAL